MIIGTKEYQLPFTYDKKRERVIDGDENSFCLIIGTPDNAHSIGQFIADALNEKAQKPPCKHKFTAVCEIGNSLDKLRFCKTCDEPLSIIKFAALREVEG